MEYLLLLGQDKLTNNKEINRWTSERGCNHVVLNTLGPEQNDRHFPDDIFKCIFLNENVWISIKVSVKFVPNGQISNIPALVQIMTWRHSGDMPLSEPMMVSLLTHICITRPQWDNYLSMTVTDIIEPPYSPTVQLFVKFCNNYNFRLYCIDSILFCGRNELKNYSRVAHK